MDRDENAAINILNKALEAVGQIVTAQGGLVDEQPVNCETFKVEEWVQLSLF